MTYQLRRAIILATKVHAGQLDKCGKPYIMHPLRVMLDFDDEELQIVAVLHDVVEDTRICLAQIEQMFGRTIGEAIDAMTRRKGESYDDFIDRCKTNRLAKLVKARDIADNMNPKRLAQLPLNEQIRLRNKYTAARERLHA